VAELRAQGVISTDQVAQAFLTIPREVFVTFFYEQEGGTWVRREAEEGEPDAWIGAVYRDKPPLITLLDEHQLPISCSSAPGAMAMMLEALAPEPGMRVLEIGAGTGYNAALLAFLVGNPTLVTTIELEESLAQAAEKALHASVGPVSVRVGDGRLGVRDRAPYNRIIATASAPGIPRAWYEQLAPGGRIVMDMKGSLGRGRFLIVEKRPNGSAVAHFDPHYLSFMPLRSRLSLATHPVSRLLREPETLHISVSSDQATDLLHGQDFQWFLQWFQPGIMLVREMPGADGRPFYTIIDPKKETIIQLSPDKPSGSWNGGWVGTQHGGEHLWDTILRAYEQWDHLGSPGLDAYSVTWEKQQ
jgi:protein-L-isoaspartate(D-aspartate) O-methyltransferase